MDKSIYGPDYYERGIETGLSCYQNYRWIAELTVPMAMTLVDFLHIKRKDVILDFGCAKGFLVKALRLLHRQAWGVDISEYAISQVPPETAEFCGLVNALSRPFPLQYDLCIAKDVFEHIELESIDRVLTRLPTKKVFAVIPLGDNGIYRAKANNYDVTHVLCKDEVWWKEQFERSGWKVLWFDFKLKGIKDNYSEACPKSHGFFILRNTWLP